MPSTGGETMKVIIWLAVLPVIPYVLGAIMEDAIKQRKSK